MEIIKTEIADVYAIECPAFADHRGAFSRLFCKNELKEVLADREIVQINHSITNSVGALRGLHYQKPPFAEMKIIRCIKGRVFDAAVDLRRGSKTFLQWVGINLSASKNNAIVIPEGFAHGFQVLEPASELLYLHTNYYMPDAEGAVRFDDPLVNLAWPLEPTDLSERDLTHPYLTNMFRGIPL